MSLACNQLNSKRILDHYAALRLNPPLYLQPVTPEAFFMHAMGLTRGVELTIGTLTFNDFVDARRHANMSCGFESRATSPAVEMREKGYSDDEILLNLISIEIRMWQILEQWEKENLSKAGAQKDEQSSPGRR
jgi:hypothetical protein